MKMKTSLLFFFIVCWIDVSSASSLKHKRNIFLRQNSDSDGIMDVSDFSIYYDLDSNQTIKNMMPRPWYKPGWRLRLPFTGGKCTCEDFKCECCTGIRIAAFNFDRRTCTVLTYEPTESMLSMEVKMNNDSVYRNTFSARNPPPFCVPIPVPYLPPGLVDMCMRLFDITVVMQKLHVCMDMDTRIDMAPVLILHFDCMDMGFDGVGLSKPTSNQTNISPSDDANMEPTQLDSDVYDPVTESSATTSQIIFNNTVKYT